MAQDSAHGLGAEPFDPSELDRPVHLEDDDKYDRLMVVQPARDLPGYDVVNVTVNDMDVKPTLLLGADTSRRRVLMRANVVDVFVGPMPLLSSYSGTAQYGYPLPIQAGDEFDTTDEMFVRFQPTAGPSGASANVFLYIERYR